MEALEELHPERHEGRISYAMGGIYTLPVKNRGAAEGSSFCGEAAGEQQQAREAGFNRRASQPVGELHTNRFVY